MDLLLLVAAGYGVALLGQGSSPQAEELVTRNRILASISEITYSDLAVPLPSDRVVICCALQSLQMLSQITLRKPLLRQRTQHFNEHKEIP